jgi:hypothetical protein
MVRPPGFDSELAETALVSDPTHHDGPTPHSGV